jgi:prepilin-type N-terminal cleavage/methylation domain-containing protein
MMPTLKRSAQGSSTRRHAGFSLVEMIGVLAIIAILAVVIVPKVFSTIASSRVTAAVASINSMKTSLTEFVGKFGTVPITNNNSRIDDLLFTAGITEGRFLVKIGTQPVNPPIAGATWARNATTGAWAATGGVNQAGQSRIICLNSNANTPSTSNGANYRLNAAVDLPAGSRVLSAVIVNLTASDARELSLRVDGDTYSQPDATSADDAGKVVYRAPNGQGLTTAYVYITHQ